MDFEVTYMSGAGNLFSVIHFNLLPEEINFSKLAKLLCNINEFNHFRTEGLIIIAPSILKNADFEAIFYNPDGSTGMMCGNGGRCAVRYALNKGFSNENLKFTLANILYEYALFKDNIKLFFNPPQQFTPNVDIEINENSAFIGDFVNVGTLHYIINYDDFVEEIGADFSEFDINKVAVPIRNHIEFAPIGVNVNFYHIVENNVFLRTFEKGVEAETGACGTGAISTAISLLWKKDLPTPINIIPTSKEALIVDFVFDGLKLSKIILEGPAKTLDCVNISISDELLN